jgi:Tfp pilus assembly PilM family ATPase
MGAAFKSLTSASAVIVQPFTYLSANFWESHSVLVSDKAATFRSSGLAMAWVVGMMILR